MAERRLPAPDDDLRKPVRFRTCRAKKLNQVRQTTATSDVGGVDAKNHVATLLVPSSPSEDVQLMMWTSPMAKKA